MSAVNVVTAGTEHLPDEQNGVKSFVTECDGQAFEDKSALLEVDALKLY